MSFYRNRHSMTSQNKGSVEDEAIFAIEGGVLSPDMSRQFGPDVLDKIANEVLPDAIERGDRSLAEKCDRVLAHYDLAYPNRVSGLWEPLEAPRSELQVRELFACKLPEFGYRLVASHTDFPDWLLLDDEGLYVYCEVEHRSSSFILHGHDAARCDLIACWEHDWPACPLPVLEFFSGRRVQPNAPTLTPKSRARLSVNFSARLSKPDSRPKPSERADRAAHAVKRFREMEAQARSVEDICREIGGELGTTPAAVRSLLRRQGILGPVRTRRKAVLDKFDELRGDYDTKSAAVEAVAKHFDITSGTVWSHLSRGRKQ